MNDPLARFRESFYLQPGVVYLDGNSLGLLCREAEAAVLGVLERWKLRGVEAWDEWFTLAERLAARVAPLLGASPEEVIVANSTTVNLHQLLATLYRPTEARCRILIDAGAFPSDQYAIASHLSLRGIDPATSIFRVGAPNGILEETDIIAAMTPEVALAVLPGVVYTTGQLLDMKTLSAAARQRGILIGFDCSHSIGAVPHKLSDWGADFAFWCSYKYLNAGPGAVGGLFLHRRHLGRAPGIAGWFSSRKERQFEMSPELLPAETAGAMQIGTPHILSLAPLDGALRLVEEAGIELLRDSSLILTERLIARFDEQVTEHGLKLVTPRDPARRGGHVALTHLEAMRICKALRAEGVVPDFRPPNIVRLAPTALYNTLDECDRAIEALARIMQRRDYERFDAGRSLVT